MRLPINSVAVIVASFISTVKGIIEGNAVLPNQFPYQVFGEAYIKGGKINDFSGAVLSSRFVITSFSSVSLGDTFTIKLGTIHPYSPCAANKHVPAKEVIPHPSKLIALLKLTKPIIFDCRIQPVALPMYNNRHRNILDYTAQATGYKMTHSSNGERHLQFLNMKVVPLSDCAKHNLTEYRELENSTLCARGVSVYGESTRGHLCTELGVPLVVLANRELVGIFTDGWRRDCKGVGPHRLIKIERFVNWIKASMKDHTTAFERFADDESDRRDEL